MDGCEWMRRFKAHLRVGVSFYNIFTDVCVWVLLFKARLWVNVPF